VTETHVILSVVRGEAAFKKSAFYSCYSVESSDIAAGQHHEGITKIWPGNN
jgi:hypothetical protein